MCGFRYCPTNGCSRTENLEPVNGEEQVVVSNVAHILRKRLDTGRGYSDKEVREYKKYHAIMFGNEDDNVDEESPNSQSNKVPKASKDRRSWTPEEDEEICDNVDFSTRPNAADAKRLIVLSTKQNGPIVRGKRTVSALNNITIMCFYRADIEFNKAAFFFG